MERKTSKYYSELKSTTFRKLKKEEKVSRPITSKKLKGMLNILVKQLKNFLDDLKIYPDTTETCN